MDKNSKILITGGLGFIGFNFVQYLQDAGYTNINVIDKGVIGSNLNLRDSLDCESLIASIGDFAAIRYVCDTKPDIIVHFAAFSHVDTSISNPTPFIQNNVTEFLPFLECLRELAETKTIKFIHVSTDEVYGALKENETAWTEDSPYAPNNPYAASKAASDMLVRSFVKTYGFPAIITHCCNNFGPYQNPEKFIPKVITNIFDRKAIPVYGQGLQQREWIFVDDHCSALLTIIKKGIVGELYNIGSDTCLTNIDLVQKILHYVKDFYYEDGTIEFVEDRKGHDFRYNLNSTKLKSLGWRPSIGLDKGLFETIRWYAEHYAGC